MLQNPTCSPPLASAPADSGATTRVLGKGPKLSGRPPDPDFELIVTDPLASFRWHRHDYPSPLARWNYHPEYEIHLITESTGAHRPELAVGGDARIGAVIEYVFEDTHDVRMSAAADIVGMNESTFSRHFRKMTGNNFVDCVRKIRIARACTLLESDDLAITEICFESGFQNISNFNRNFRREKGMTPREYRSCIRMRRAGRAG
jgi:AraC-like DNA-binding protein